MKTILCIVIFCLTALVHNTSAQVNLSLLSKDSLTPNLTDTIGAFSRIFYHEGRDRFYLVYAARLYGQPTPAGVLNNFTWIELDNSLNETGSSGILPSQMGAGDFAMVMVDTNYYHLTVGGSGDYLLSKYDDDFVLIDQIIIPLDPCESNIDQLMNYTNGRLVIGAMYDAVICPPINPPSPSLMPYSDIYQYDLDLNEIAPHVLLPAPSKITWGSSMIFNGTSYFEITMNNFNDRDLYVYEYDDNFNYVNSTLIDNDGQWSQGVIFDGTYYYIAFHTGDHNHGNIKIKIFDVNWNLIHTTDATNYFVPSSGGYHSYNANRPFLLKKGDKLYISYDVESYDYPANNKDWQAHLDVYQINGLATIENTSSDSPVTVYPNPASDFLLIGTNENYFRLEVRNSDGKLMEEFVNEKTIPIDKLESGIYIIQYFSETIQKAFTVIINH